MDQVGLQPPGFVDAAPSLTLPTERGPATVSLAPSLRLLRVDHAVLSMWQAIAGGRYDDLATLDWRRGPEWLAVHHGDDDVIVTSLRPATWDLCASLLDDDGPPMTADDDPAATASEFLAAPFVRLTFTAATE